MYNQIFLKSIIEQGTLKDQHYIRIYDSII